MIKHNKKFLQALKEKALEMQEGELKKGKSGRKYELHKQAILQGLAYARTLLTDRLHAPPIQSSFFTTSHNPENIHIMKRKTTPRTGEIQITATGKRRKQIAHK